MNEVNIKKAYYIKLGSKNDKWEDECIKKGTIRIGWSVVKNIDYINNWNSKEIERLIQLDYKTRGKKNGATQDFNALKLFCEATEEDIFITFYKSKMYWCNPSNEPLKRYDENSQTDFTKVRETKNGWKCSPINNPEKIFHSNEISGQISKTQAFQGTFCSFTEKELEIINRLINGIPNPVVKKIKKHREKIIRSIVKLLKELHWKDCEILTDLIFLHSGWRRISMSGGSMEFIDMEYEEPINNYKYAVQVKAKANKNDIEKYIKNLEGRHFEKMFFVVFYPDESIKKEYQMNQNNLEIIDGEKLANYIFDLGLLNWLLKKSW